MSLEELARRRVRLTRAHKASEGISVKNQKLLAPIVAEMRRRGMRSWDALQDGKIRAVGSSLHPVSEAAVEQMKVMG